MPSQQTSATRSAVKLALIALFSFALLAAAVGCRVSTHPVEPAGLGTPISSDAMVALLAEPGPVTVETVVAADWVVDRAGLINLDHDEAKAHGIESGDEPIHIAMHVLRHPSRGMYLVDTGVERMFVTAPGDALISGLVGSVVNIDAMKVHVDTATYLSRQPEKPAGVLLTHLHLDHITGMRDVPQDVPVFAGPGETSERSLQNLFVQGVTDDALAGKGPLRELTFRPDPAGRFDGVLDLFGDGSTFALWVPGHTAGSTAYLVRTPSGPVLLVGDACHTAWGWEHGVEPGSFSSDQPQSAVSLARLRRLVAEHPAIDVRLGHQPRRVAAGVQSAMPVAQTLAKSP